MKAKRFMTPQEMFALTSGKLVMEWRRFHCTENFKWGELFVHRTVAQVKTVTLEVLINLHKMAMKMEEVRKFLGSKAINITSGWRDLASNTAAGGARKSTHITGKGIDFTVAGLHPRQVQAKLEKWWVGGLGYGLTFTHLDDRGHNARFNY